MKLYLIFLFVIVTCAFTVFGATVKKNSDEEKENKDVSKIESKEILVNNSSESIEALPIVRTKSTKTRNALTKQIKRGSTKGNSIKPPKPKKQKDLMSRILPMMIIPFMLQTAIIPMMLTMLKVSLLKAAFIGKLAILVGLINMFRVSTNQGGVFTHNINVEEKSPMHQQLAHTHYGYTGDDEYGAYVNRRR